METNILEALNALFEPNKRIYWLYIVSSALIALVYLRYFKESARVHLSAKLWLHKSAVLDYKYFVLSFFLKTIFIVPIVFGINEVSIFTYDFLLEQYGFVKVTALSYTQIMTLFTLTLFVVSDFTRYWLHRVMHTIPFLWEFHKVHHSAKVLTPITFYRVHPIENILFGMRYSLSTGVVSGVFIYLFGSMVGVVEILGVNALLFLFLLAGSNLRHSHIKVSYPLGIENIFISPLQHQLHHTTKYFDKNYGGYLALWDKLFGSLQTSKSVLASKEKLRFGVQTKSFQTLSALLFTPFQNIFKGIHYAK
ncbi:MAG: sterol desaturase family protein [Sulfurimonas sp.]|jgi:sterol desaturase/sphingolipid hydroxylase (fatty acid hydroxylase superfamily)